MSKILIVSGKVDNLIKEHAEGDDVYWFLNMTKLSEYLGNNRLKVDIMYFTRDVLEPTITSNLTLMLELLDNPFLVIKEVVYLTEMNSPEIDTVEYLMRERHLLNWTLHEGSLTRDYITNYTLGKSENLELNPSRKVIFRERLGKLSDKRVNNDDMEELDDDYDLDDDLEVDKDIIPNDEFVHIEEDLRNCKVKYVSGLDCKERTAFVIILAQYLAKKNKVVLVENDNKFLEMTDMLVRSGVDCLKVSMDNLYRDPEATINTIKSSQEQLVIITPRSSEGLVSNYEFVCNLLYYNLKDSIDYLMKEVELEDLNPSTEYICVLPNNVVDILKTSKKLVSNYKKKCKFVVIEATSISELRIRDSKALSALVRDLLELDKLNLQIFRVNSLKLGGSINDLFMYQ